MNPFRARLKHMEMRLRAATPAPVKTLFRAGRGLVETQQASPPLPPDLVADCRVCASRLDLIERLPKGGVVAELGTYMGHFAHEILRRAQPSALHLIDIDFTQTDPAVLALPRVVRHEGLTHNVLATFPDASFDWIYVDADHSYAGVARDARASAPKVKPGGYLVFNDFAHVDLNQGRYGVHRAVVEFAIAERWPLVWLAYQSAGLYDVALRKPG